MKVIEARLIIEKQKGKREQILNDLKYNKAQRKRLRKDIVNHEKAREILRTVGKQTQEQLVYHLEDITSLAMESIFEEPYKIAIEFVQKRGKTECIISFTRGKSKVNPLDAAGGGAADIASFALRIASWSLNTPRTRNVMILDEPMKNIDATLREKASMLLKEISKKLNIQFIIVTHDTTLTEYADKIFTVTQTKGVSKIKETIIEPKMY